MRCFLNRLIFVIVSILLSINTGAAQELKYQNIGRTPSTEEIKKWDISVGPRGDELPPGRGTAQEGEQIFLQKCIQCHGPSGAGGLAPRLVGSIKPGNSAWKYIGVSAWPYATTIWDFINRSMPITTSAVVPVKSGPLNSDEVYALTAYLLYLSDIIEKDTVLDAKKLPAIVMPTRDNFFPKSDELDWKPREYKKYGIYPTYPE